MMHYAAVLVGVVLAAVLIQTPANRLATESQNVSKTPPPAKPSSASAHAHHLRFHAKHSHLHATFGNDWFALKAEAFARFFGTPTFLIGQTVVVVIWIVLNVTGLAKFDIYPFILLNLAFSLQAAYAAPLILLAQTRQADRDKALAEADAAHREDLAQATADRQAIAAQQSEILLDMVKQNTELTGTIKELTERVATLTAEVHTRMCPIDPPATRAKK